MRLVDGRAKSVPTVLSIKDVEIIRFMAVSGLAGEYADAVWWAREDQFSDGAVMAAIKKSWARVNKEALDQPLYAPKFPGAAGAKANWDALLNHVIELHNDGKVDGLISFGSRKEWPRAATCTRTQKQPIEHRMNLYIL